MASPKSSTFTEPSPAKTTFEGFEIAVDDSPLVRGFERLGNLLRHGKGSRDRQAAAAAPGATLQVLCKRFAVHQFQNEGWHTVHVLQPVDGPDVRVIERRQHARLALEAQPTFGI